MKVIAPLSPEERALLDGWRYDPPYEFYNGEDDPVLNPERFYVVRPADTLWSIAERRYGGDVREAVWRIREANGLEDATITPGQRLLLP